MQGLARKIFCSIFVGSVLVGCGTRTKTNVRTIASDSKKNGADQTSSGAQQTPPPAVDKDSNTPSNTDTGPVPSGVPASTLTWDGTSSVGSAELQLVPMN